MKFYRLVSDFPRILLTKSGYTAHLKHEKAFRKRMATDEELQQLFTEQLKTIVGRILSCYFFNDVLSPVKPQALWQAPAFGPIDEGASGDFDLKALGGQKVLDMVDGDLYVQQWVDKVLYINMCVLLIHSNSHKHLRMFFHYLLMICLTSVIAQTLIMSLC